MLKQLDNMKFSKSIKIFYNWIIFQTLIGIMENVNSQISKSLNATIAQTQRLQYIILLEMELANSVQIIVKSAVVKISAQNVNLDTNGILSYNHFRYFILLGQ